MSKNSTSFDVPSVKELTKSPSTTFITFSENDCDHSGSTKHLIVNWVHPLVLKAKVASIKEDNLTWWEAILGSFADEYWKVAITEIETVEAMNTLELVDHTEDMNVLLSTWALKLKSSLDGLIKKFKALFYVRVDQQIEGIDFFETNASVTQWTTI